jgi:hypothetical protein
LAEGVGDVVHQFREGNGDIRPTRYGGKGARRRA